MVRFGAIDVGSNAIRASVAICDPHNLYQIIEKKRYAIRLGRDAFLYGKFSAKMLAKALGAFKDVADFFEEHEVDHNLCYATSAFREASNSNELKKQVISETGIDIQTISGEEEAQLIYEAVFHTTDDRFPHILLVDIGGGSLELTVVRDGLVYDLESFNLGTVRMLNLVEKNTDEYSQYLEEYSLKIRAFLERSCSGHETVEIIGTGGNARRLGKLRKRFFDKKSNTKIKKDELSYFYEEMKNIKAYERVNKFDLEPDRAEVIVPAMKIFLMLLEQTKEEKISFPRAGLIDGIFLKLLSSLP